MADNRINIIIEAITKGEKNTKALTDAIDSGFKRGKLAVDAFNAASGNGEKAIAGMRQGVTDLVKAYVGIEAAKQGFQAMIRIIGDGEKAQFNMATSIKAANREFSNVGSLTTWKTSIKDISDYLVIYSESAVKNAISRTVDMTKRLGLSADQMQELIKRTGDLSAGKTDLEGGIERVTAALRGEAEASEYLGLTLNETYVTAWHNAHNEHNKAWKDLTDLEKAQVRYQVFLEQTNEFQGRAAESSKTFGGALQLLQKAIEDAVTNNQDLAAAMRDVATYIRENAASIGELAADLITVTAKVIQFAIEWREVLVAFAATYAVTRSVTLLISVINGLSAALVVLRATGLASAFTGLAAGATQALVAGLPLATWMSGGLALAATFAATQIWTLVTAYMEMKKWEDAAREASEQRVAIDDKANVKARELGKSLGLSINSIADFNKAVKDGRISWDETTQSWKKGTEVIKETTKAVALTETQLKDLDKVLGSVGNAYDFLRGRITTYYDFAAQRAGLLAKDERQASLLSVDIAKKKMDQIMALAEQEAKRKAEIVRQSGADEKQMADEIKKISEDLRNARIKALSDWESQLQKAYTDAIGRERKYAAEVKQLQEHLRDVRTSNAQTLRDLQRKTMTDEEALQDRQKQAMEELQNAQNNLWSSNADDVKKSEESAKKAASQFVEMANALDMGKDATQANKDAFVGYIELIKQAQALEEQAAQRQVDLAEEKRVKADKDAKALLKTWDDVKGKILQVFNEVNEAVAKQLNDIDARIKKIAETPITPKVDFTPDMAAIDAAIQQISKPIVVPVYYQTQNSPSGGGSSTEESTFREGGQLSGWGGGDKIKALLEAGEYVIRKEAVAKYGAGLFHALNNMRLDIPRLLAGAMPSLPAISRPGYATGGAVGSAETLTVRFQAGGAEYPVQIADRGSRQMMKQFARELEKMRLTRGH